MLILDEKTRATITDAQIEEHAARWSGFVEGCAMPPECCRDYMRTMIEGACRAIREGYDADILAETCKTAIWAADYLQHFEPEHDPHFWGNHTANAVRGFCSKVQGFPNIRRIA